jgi:hypothetical protein
MVKKLLDTTIPQALSTESYEKLLYNLPKEHVGKVLDVLVYGVTSALSALKRQDKPIGFVFRDKGKEFICAAYVQFQQNEENPNEPGNWDYAWTFYEDDLPDNMEELNTYRGDLMQFFRTRSSSVYGFYHKTVEIWGDISSVLMRIIASWLQENTTEGEETEMSLENIITFKSSVNGDGEIEKSIEVEPEIKSLIKANGADEASSIAA